MRKPFQFKRFNVQDENCAMKVGTDAVVLGAWINAENSKSILDIGTGSGIIALMLAQKSSATIDAIDIDSASIHDAEKNFKESPWSEKLKAIHCSLSAYAYQSEKKYDLILSNPPYFINSLKSVSERKNISKHTSTLNHEELLSGAKSLITPEGRFSVIIPYDQVDSFVNIALVEGLFCINKLIIYPTKKKPANRIILEFSLNRSDKTKEGELTIRDNLGSFTEQYKNLTKDFYLNF